MAQTEACIRLKGTGKLEEREGEGASRLSVSLPEMFHLYLFVPNLIANSFKLGPVS